MGQLCYNSKWGSSDNSFDTRCDIADSVNVSSEAVTPPPPPQHQHIHVPFNILYISPVNGRGPSVSGEDGRVVDDGTMLRMVYHFHGDELRAEWKHVEVSVDTLVLLQHL